MAIRRTQGIYMRERHSNGAPPKHVTLEKKPSASEWTPQQGKEGKLRVAKEERKG